MFLFRNAEYLEENGKTGSNYWINDGIDGQCLALKKFEGKEFDCDTERNFICEFGEGKIFFDSIYEFDDKTAQKFVKKVDV